MAREAANSRYDSQSVTRHHHERESDSERTERQRHTRLLRDLGAVSHRDGGRPRAADGAAIGAGRLCRFLDGRHAGDQRRPDRLDDHVRV